MNRIGSVLLLVAAVSLCFAASGYAQEFERSAKVTVGLGISFVGTDDARVKDIDGTGLFLQGEYVFESERTVKPAIYVGAILTSPRESSCDSLYSPCDVSTKAIFGGAKARFIIPIPRVAPFFELGVGASVGSFQTRIGNLYEEDKGGVLFHIPIALGVTIGRDTPIDVGFSYLMYPTLDHIDGAAAVTFNVWRE